MAKNSRVKNHGTDNRFALVPYPGTVGTTATSVRCIAFTSNMSRVVTDGGAVYVWEYRSGRHIGTLPHEGYVWQIVPSANNREMYTCGGVTIRKWNVETLKEEYVLSGHQDSVYRICLARDESVLVSSSGDKTLKVWDLEKKRERFTLIGHLDAPLFIKTYSDTGLAAADGSAPVIKLWDFRKGTLVGELAGHKATINGLCITPNRQNAISLDESGTIIVWDLVSARLVSLMQGDAIGWDVVLSPDGNLAISSHGDLIRVWDLASGRLQFSLAGHTASVTSLSLSPDGCLLLSGSSDKTMRLWEMGTRECVQTCKLKPADDVTACRFSADGRTAILGDERGRVAFFSVNVSGERLVEPTVLEAPTGPTLEDLERMESQTRVLQISEAASR